jgi:short subunit fatty acids transporter
MALLLAEVSRQWLMAGTEFHSTVYAYVGGVMSVQRHISGVWVQFHLTTAPIVRSLFRTNLTPVHPYTTMIRYTLVLQLPSCHYRSTQHWK